MKRCLHLVILVFLSVFFFGCLTTEYNLATNKQETLLYGTGKEIKIGDSVSRQLEAKHSISTQIDINEQAQRVFHRIVAVCDRKELVYIIKIIDEEELNALSLPGGYVYVYKGLLDKLENDDQLAGIIAHEIGHITAKHAMKRLQGSYGAIAAQILAVGTGDPKAVGATNLALASIISGYSRQDELEADRLAVKYTRKAGYDPNAMLDVLNLLKEEMLESPRRPVALFRTHPHLNERIAALNMELKGKMEFKDYLNLTQEEDVF